MAKNEALQGSFYCEPGAEFETPLAQSMHGENGTNLL